jgi:methionine aminopeptidase
MTDKNTQDSFELLLTKYNTCAKICGTIITEITSLINSGKMLNVSALCKYGDLRIKEETDKIYKRENDKGIAFPTSISLNNCVGYYIYEEDRDEYNNIKEGDVVKIELGVNISGCIANLAETIIYTPKQQNLEESSVVSLNSSEQKYIDLLNNLQNEIYKILLDGNVNSDVRILIESKCTEAGCFPVENVTSYQHLDSQLQTSESKYIITNYQSYYHDDQLAVLPNNSFEFKNGEVYTINLTIIPNNIEQQDETAHNYIEMHEPHIYRYNNLYYGLRLKSSKEFLSNVKKEHSTNAFNCIDYKTKSKYKLGIKECYQNGILENYPILYSKDKKPIFHKKFTVIVGEKRCVKLKYY